MLKTRAITGVILAIVGLLIVFGLKGQWFDAVVAVILAIGAYEWAGFIKGNHRWFKLVYAVIFLVCSVIPATAGIQSITLIIGCIFWVLGFVSLFLSRNLIKKLLSPIPATILGLCYLIPAFVAFSLVHSLAPFAVLYAVLVVAGSDIGAYFAGKAFGRHKLAPKLSPKKTWEGFAGGLIAGVALSLILSHWVYFPTSHHYLVLSGVSIVLVIFGVVGDLFESQFKRAANIKDSGSILPGHGGILDRFDSHLAAMVVFATVIYFL